MAHSMSDFLFTTIEKKVYKDKEIREVSLNSTDKERAWVFDFKGEVLSPFFLKEYSKHFWSFVQDHFKHTRVQIGGMETGAIPIVTGVALCAPEGTSVQSFYIRKSRKKSDLANLIEGEVLKDVPIVLVDDILNRGATVAKQIKILEDLGHKVSAVFVCLRFRDLSYYQDLTKKGIIVKSIFELNDFSKVLPVKNMTDGPVSPLPVAYTPLWSVALTKKLNLYLVVPKSGPVLDGEHIYVGADDGTFFCLAKESGKVIWTYKVMFGSAGKRIFSTPCVYKNFVMFGAYDGNLYCLNKLTGKREWVFTDADWIGSSPCVNEARGVVFVGLEFGLFKKRGGVVAVDITTGEALWKYYEMTGLTHASPSYNKKANIVVCGSNDGNVYAFKATTGSLVWKFQTQGEVKYGAVFDDKRGLVIIGSMDGGLYVLTLKDGTLYHKFEARFGLYSTSTLDKDHVIIGSLDKILYCFDIAKKETVWTFETSGRIFASPIVDRDSVFVGSNDGRLYEVEMRSGKLLTHLQLSERIVNRIQIEHDEAGKRILYVPTHACGLYAFKEL